MMTRFDLIKLTLEWVWGYCILWNQRTKKFSDPSSVEFRTFVHHTHRIVWKVLNKAPSDLYPISEMELNIVDRAQLLFNQHFVSVKINELEEQLGVADLDDDSN